MEICVLFILKIVLLLYLNFDERGLRVGVHNYLDLIKYTQSYIKGFIKGYIDLIFIRYDIGFIYMDAVWYKISIVIETSIKISILEFWYGWGCWDFYFYCDFY